MEKETKAEKRKRLAKERRDKRYDKYRERTGDLADRGLLASDRSEPWYSEREGRMIQFCSYQPGFRNDATCECPCNGDC